MKSRTPMTTISRAANPTQPAQKPFDAIAVLLPSAG
jgi:hypothetical protein